MLAEFVADSIAVIDSMPDRLSRSQSARCANGGLFPFREDNGAWISDLRWSVGRSKPFVAQSLALRGLFWSPVRRQACAQPLRPFLERPKRTRRSGTEAQAINRNCQIPLIPTGRLRAEPAYLARLLSTFALSGCAIFSPDGEMTVVVNVAGLRRSLTIDAAVQIALLNNRGLHNDLALAESVLGQESLQPNPTFSIAGLVGDGGLEAERQVVGNILASPHRIRHFGPRSRQILPTNTTAPRRRRCGSQQRGRTFAPSSPTNWWN